MNPVSATTQSAPREFVMFDQARNKVAAIMREPVAATNASDRPQDGPILTRPGWVAVTLLVIAFNVMVVLPTPV